MIVFGYYGIKKENKLGTEICTRYYHQLVDSFDYHSMEAIKYKPHSFYRKYHLAEITKIIGINAPDTSILELVGYLEKNTPSIKDTLANKARERYHKEVLNKDNTNYQEASILSKFIRIITIAMRNM